MSSPLDVLTRGADTSGRTVAATRQAWQHFDRVNAHVGGKLVIVQGAFRARYGGGAGASAGTHDSAGCLDIRTWNLTKDERDTAQREARRLGAAAWYRHQGQGFDPHMHWVLLGDSPMHPAAAQQVTAYKNGRNGLASNGPDDFWRPSRIENYRYLSEEDEVKQEDIDKIVDAVVDRLPGAVWRHDIPVDEGTKKPAQLVLRWVHNRVKGGDGEKPTPKAS